MTGFSADWLALREAADRRARNATLARTLSDHLRAPRGRPLRVIDIGAGSGNNMAATAALLPRPQHWLLADSDPLLLARAAARGCDGISVETREADLAGGIGPLLAEGADLVTASAFLDLCGTEWLAGLAETLAAAGAALYAVLSYDGRETWDPAHPLDAAALAAFHADQRRDKGLGLSLGPGAHRALAGLLAARGFDVREGASDWQLAQPGDRALIAALAEGIAAAVAGQIGEEAAASWLAARREARRVTIGHRDLLALPSRR